MSDSFFYPYCCHLCKVFTPDLKKCSQCKLVSYCGAEHQKRHWPAHREFCRTVGCIVKKFNLHGIFVEGSDKESWESIRSLAMCWVEQKIERSLSLSERQMFWFPAVCALCRQVRIDLLLVCQGCRCVSYCTRHHMKAHRKQHATICHQLNLCFKLDNVMAGVGYAHPEVTILVQFEKHLLPKCMNEFIQTYVKESTLEYFSEVASEMLTCIGTVIHAIERAKLTSKIGEKLIIHLVGVDFSSPERGFINFFEFLLHWYVNVKEFNVVFLGPSASPVAKPSLCSECQNKVINFSFHNQFYHDFVLSSDFVQPDLIFIFNCGFHENQSSPFDPWKETISLLCDSKLLTVFTSYNKQESVMDFNRFIEFKPESKCVTIVDQSVKNPFKSLRPHRDWENDSIYYQNYYINIINTMDSSVS